MKRSMTPGANAPSAQAWELVRQRKLAHWVQRYREAGPAGALEVATDLHDPMRQLRPDWPTAEEREADPAHHLAMRALLDKAAQALVFLARRAPAR